MSEAQVELMVPGVIEVHADREPNLSRGRIVCSMALVLALGVASEARAQDPLPEDASVTEDAPVPEDTPEEEAEGERDAGDLAAGTTALEEGRWLDAHRALSRALEEPLPEAERAEVRALLERALGHLGRLTVPAAPEGSVLAVDDELVEVSGAWPAEPGTIVLSSGLHRFQIRLPDGRSTTADSSVAGGEVGPLSIFLDELDEPAPAATPDEDHALPPDGPSAEPLAAGPQFPAGWVLFAVGLGTAAVGGVLLPLGVSGAFAMDGVDISQDRLRNTLRGMGGAILSIGGSLAILGMVIALGEERDDEPAAD